MYYPSTNLAEILRDKDRYVIERARLQSSEQMVADLQQRLTNSAGSWTVAVIRAVDDTHGPVRVTSGMVVLRPQLNTDKFEGIYYRQADCGAYRTNVRITAELLCLLAYGTNEKLRVDHLYENFLAFYTKIIVTGLNTDWPDFLPA